MVRTQNGFELAELDLELRGPGEFFGTRQAGMPSISASANLREAASGQRVSKSASQQVSESASQRVSKSASQRVSECAIATLRKQRSQDCPDSELADLLTC
jgi:ATP-dependent DNA helicase RecG